ncbi:MAG: hypothetical protein, partial [Olavius algarvensis Gamma 1 endosymbiont]
DRRLSSTRLCPTYSPTGFQANRLFQQGLSFGSP